MEIGGRCLFGSRQFLSFELYGESLEPSSEWTEARQALSTIYVYVCMVISTTYRIGWVVVDSVRDIT